ncbi:MAG: IS1634 family transposase [Steroidobacteraceae bacterium]
MFLRKTQRKKDGKTHEYWSVVENKRVAGGRVVQRHVLYLGEINSSQAVVWRKAIEVLDDDTGRARTMALFPEDRCAAAAPEAPVVQLRLTEMRLCRPRQWGACWLAGQLWRELQLDRFWADRLPSSRKGTPWGQVLQLLVSYRLIAPGSEWKLHRQWFGNSAMADLLGADFGLAEAHKLYACHDFLLPHKEALFAHLTARWRDLFNVNFDVLLYDLTSTYFEINASDVAEGDKRRHGYSRDKRPDCPQVVIALVVTPDGLPVAYEVLPGNTADCTTLRLFLDRIEQQYGRARRVWVMDRGIPTEAVLAAMRRSDPPVQYLVGTPKGRLSRLEQRLVAEPWREARAGVAVKLLAEDGELYVFAESVDRVRKERAMRRRQLKWLWKRLRELAAMEIPREEMLMKLGAARARAPTAWRLVDIEIDKQGARFIYALNRQKLRRIRRREGRYLLRTNLTENDPALLWQYYTQLVAVEEAFKNLKGDLAIRPIFHQDGRRVEAHIFIAFLAYCLQITLQRRLHALAPGLTPRSALETFAAVQMIDVHLPTTDGRELLLTRYTQPEPELRLLLQQLKLDLPPQPPPRITPAAASPSNLM